MPAARRRAAWADAVHHRSERSGVHQTTSGGPDAPRRPPSVEDRRVPPYNASAPNGSAATTHGRARARRRRGSGPRDDRAACAHIAGGLMDHRVWPSALLCLADPGTPPQDRRGARLSASVTFARVMSATAICACVELRARARERGSPCAGFAWRGMGLRWRAGPSGGASRAGAALPAPPGAVRGGELPEQPLCAVDGQWCRFWVSAASWVVKDAVIASPALCSRPGRCDGPPTRMREPRTSPRRSWQAGTLDQGRSRRPVDWNGGT